MKILAVNAGSSSLKVSLYEMQQESLMINIVFERIGLAKTFYIINYQGKKEKKECFFPDHGAAVKIFLTELINLNVIKDIKEIKGIGHRVVHGGPKYKEATLITAEVLKQVAAFGKIVPLHNPANLVAIKAFQKVLPLVPHFAVFDTAFHQTMLPEAFLYPVPYDWYLKYEVRKYGFHGISHQYVSKRISVILKRTDLKVITCHLGNGGSISAVKAGICLDTSFGFTPLSGLMGGTRCGDIDVSLIPYVKEQSNQDLETIMTQLQRKSGLLGVSGVSNDFREIEAGIKANDERCLLALEMYVNRVIMYISYYNTLLEGADVIVFTAGIGENSSLVRKAIMEKLQPLGIKIDYNNNLSRGIEQEITTTMSKIKCYIIPTNEELMMAQEVLKFIK